MPNPRRRQYISLPELRSKLTTIVSRHEQVEVAYNRLRSQINTGLLQAEEVFQSLAAPLMKLVGLKTSEMAGEGRFTSIVFGSGLSPVVPEKGAPWREFFGHEWGDRSNRTVPMKDEKLYARATVASNELTKNQQLQLVKLVGLLRHIESQVNCHHDTIIQRLHKYGYFLHKLYQRAIHRASTIRLEENDTVMLLQIVFKNVSAVLLSVEDDVEGLIQGLSEQMCNPLVEHANGLKNNIENGTCITAVVEDMRRMMQDGRHELEDAKQQARVAEAKWLQALYQLQDREEKMKRIELQLLSLSEVSIGHTESSCPRMVSGIEGSQTDRENLALEPSKKRRRSQFPNSPMVHNELLYSATNIKARNSPRMTSAVNHRPVTRSLCGSKTAKATRLNPYIPLGLSPSATQPQRAISTKRKYSCC